MSMNVLAIAGEFSSSWLEVLAYHRTFRIFLIRAGI